MADEKENKKWEEKILAYALKNALSHEGKAVEGAVISSLFHEGLKKEQVKDVIGKVKATVKEINILSLEEQAKKFKALEKGVSRRKERTGLPELKNAKIGKVVTRLAPEPSKYNHIGHALTFLLNYIYAKKYKGKCKLRFEDTNPEKVSQEYINAMKEDVLDYLGVKVSSIRYVSDDMEKLYKYAEKLIKLGKAYMCFCKREEMQNLRKLGKECSCRQHDIKKNLEEWRNFLQGDYMNNKAVLRIKGDMLSKNYVMRDSVLFRAVKTKHYRHKSKYKVWPIFDFYNPIEDHLMNVTHILRSNEFDVRVELQDYIKNLLNLKKQTIVQYGRFNVIGATTKGREIRQLIESGKYIGWDDPRLMTLKALKRRGILKETFYELAEKVGLSKYQANLNFDMIASINRKIIDKQADRHSFISNPVKLKIVNFPEIKEVEIKIHPDKNDKRKIKIGGDIYISNKDYEENLGKEVRLMHLFNLKLNENNKAEFTSWDNKDIQKIQWVSEFVNARILMPSGEWINGIAERAVKKFKKGKIIQFERFGFCRYDKKNMAGEYEFWFAHQ